MDAKDEMICADCGKPIEDVWVSNHTKDKYFHVECLNGDYFPLIPEPEVIKKWREENENIIP